MKMMGRLPALVAGIIGMGTGMVMAQPEADERIRQLEQRIEALESEQNGPAPSAGWRNGFYLGDPEGDFYLRPNVQMQYRYMWNHRTDGDGTTEQGPQLRRLKLTLEGHVLSQDLTYDFTWAHGRGDGLVTLENGYFQWKFQEELSLRVGQFKAPVHHEELTSSKRQMAVDRSQVNELIGGRRTKFTQGIGLIHGSSDKPLRLEGMLHGGAGQRNLDFDRRAYDFGVAGRASYKVFGDWRPYRDFSARGTSQDTLVLGTGADWSQLGSGNDYRYTADAFYNAESGLGLYAAVLGETLDRDAFTATNYGGLVQASYALTPKWEPFARYSYTRMDTDDPRLTPAITNRDYHEIAAGVNHYFGSEGRHGHSAKLTLEGVWLPKGSPIRDSGTGALQGQDDQFMVRTQFQLLF